MAKAGSVGEPAAQWDPAALIPKPWSAVRAVTGDMSTDSAPYVKCPLSYAPLIGAKCYTLALTILWERLTVPPRPKVSWSRNSGSCRVVSLPPADRASLSRDQLKPGKAEAASTAPESVVSPPQDVTTQSVMGFDPLPPLDTIYSYVRPERYGPCLSS